MKEEKVFISGSMQLRRLPEPVMASIDKIIEQKLTILVGDASGLDTLVQQYCAQQGYTHARVYTVLNEPRNIAKGFEAVRIPPARKGQKGRDLQTEKDAAMTQASEYSLVVWDGKSRGSYNNIIRALSSDKKIRVYLAEEDKYLEREELNCENITNHYRKNTGYSGKEIVELLRKEGYVKFRDTRSLYEYLMDLEIVTKIKRTYSPNPKYQELFYIDEYMGRPKGVKFRIQFLRWIKKHLESATNEASHEKVKQAVAHPDE